MADRIEVLKTVKLGRGRDKTYTKGRILVGKDIIDVVRIELSKKTGTLRKLEPSAEVSSNKPNHSAPQFIEEEVKTENIVSSEEKKEQSVPKRRGRNVPK